MFGAVLSLGLVAGAADVHDVCREPPHEARLQMWYHWIGDCVTEEGIVADMKAMGFPWTKNVDK